MNFEKGNALDSVISIGFRLKWEHPVIVRQGRIGDKAIQSPREALKYLADSFTIRGGQPYWRAIGACNAALRYRGDVERSRDCFVAAYAEYLVNLHPN